MYIRMNKPERILHQIPKDWAILRKTTKLTPVSNRYWIGILIREEKKTYLVQTYGYCEDSTISVFVKYTPKYMRGPIHKLP